MHVHSWISIDRISLDRVAREEVVHIHVAVGLELLQKLLSKLSMGLWWEIAKEVPDCLLDLCGIKLWTSNWCVSVFGISVL